MAAATSSKARSRSGTVIRRTRSGKKSTIGTLVRSGNCKPLPAAARVHQRCVAACGGDANLAVGSFGERGLLLAHFLLSWNKLGGFCRRFLFWTEAVAEGL